CGHLCLHSFPTRRSSDLFFHDFLIDRGLKKVIYINDQSPLELRALMFNSPHLIESYGKGYDMRWENEWRIKGSLEFKDNDVAFRSEEHTSELQSRENLVC